MTSLRRRIIKGRRWARKNPEKAQVLILRAQMKFLEANRKEFRNLLDEAFSLYWEGIKFPRIDYDWVTVTVPVSLKENNQNE